MNDGVHEPLGLYQAFFKDAHARNVAEFFEDLVRRSGVDERENIKTVAELRKIEGHVAGEATTAKYWKAALWLAAIAFAGCELYVGTNFDWPWIIGGIIFFAPLLYKIRSVLRDVGGRLKNLEGQRDAKRGEAYRQLQPLNRLYGWDMVAQLVQKTIPLIAMDDYFSVGRLSELKQNFGWDDHFNDERSIMFSHTGTLNGNPFVIARTLDHWMGTKTYHGSLTISWTEQERDADGEWRTVTHHETLHASINRPFPEYSERSFVIYGNEAAPDLSFSRAPSHLSGLSDGAISNWRKGREIKKLEAKARKIEDGKSFTVMANREFDALFGASDRNHEVQFRLLFTPLAQQEMLKLLKDSQIGYGDDFRFAKNGMITIVQPEHMTASGIDGGPERFHAYDLVGARQFFNQYHNNLFRSIYFGIAPLLVIPLYQQHRSHSDIYRDVLGASSSFWEHEAIANYFGEDAFQHPECVTRSILKTDARREDDGVQTVQVTASGYSGLERVTYVSVHGGDGFSHEVPVHWVEYTDVQRRSAMIVREKAGAGTGERQAGSDDDALLSELFRKRGVDVNNAILRRSVMAALYPGH